MLGFVVFILYSLSACLRASHYCKAQIFGFRFSTSISWMQNQNLIVMMNTEHFCAILLIDKTIWNGSHRFSIDFPKPRTRSIVLWKTYLFHCTFSSHKLNRNNINFQINRRPPQKFIIPIEFCQNQWLLSSFNSFRSI